jgi:hypothetical protein
VQGGKNRRRGKNENDNEKRELTFKEDGQGAFKLVVAPTTAIIFSFPGEKQSLAEAS